jgi:hypothetical protein
MVGSDKQIAWAEEIRSTYRESRIVLAARAAKLTQEQATAYIDALLRTFSDTARWWIDNRHDLPSIGTREAIASWVAEHYPDYKVAVENLIERKLRDCELRLKEVEEREKAMAERERVFTLKLAELSSAANCFHPYEGSKRHEIIAAYERLQKGINSMNV